ncbi:MAG TPA: AI-2E family transporter [Vitreimonas sp.]|uniref:AI-2E family transporter n=1 Tax=Vitreimonas sp. TaxID=3069702 RepID=UPI002D611535|nr:AI-2E family transporter [Vitreimonas sp.]HYD89004.1 AI-2E family transporter [Vitreimonas sp.]
MPHGAVPDKGTFTSRVAIVVFAALLIALVIALRHVLLLVFGAVLIAVGLRGLAGAIQRRARLTKAGAMVVAGLIVLGALGGLFYLLGAQIAAQISQLTETLPAAWSSFRERIDQNEFASSVVGELQGAFSGTNGSQLGAYASRIGAFTMSAAGATLELFLVIVGGVFFTVNPNAYVDGALTLAPKQHRDNIREALGASAHALRRWLLGTLLSMAFIAVTVSIGLWALGVPAFLALGLLCGLAQFVPLIGPILAAVPGVLLALTVGPQTALWATLLYFITAQVEANLLTPMIQQRAVSLPPGLLLFGVIAGALLLGPLGALFATPLIVVIAVFVVIFYVRGVLGDADAKAPGA